MKANFRVATLLFTLISLSWTVSSFAVSEQALQQGIPSLAPMLEKVTPAVVNIRVTKSIADNNRNFFGGNRIPRELRRYFPDFPDSETRQRRPFSVGAGSGVIIGAEAGHVVTNHHVVAGADSIIVQLADNRSLEAELIGSDANTDIALLQIASEDLAEIELAEIDSVQVGDFVVAIGNPFGIGQTVTSGIVSALGRTGLNNENYEDFIQTDAAINVGNSGGALVDLQGRLIGINTAIISGDGGNNGIGFAVPVDMVAAVSSHLERDGEVRRGMLGVTIMSVTPDVARTIELGIDTGALVTSVLEGSAAERAGIQVSDVIIELNGESVEGGRDLRNRIGLLRRDEKVSLSLVREGETLSIAAVIGDQTGSASTADPRPAEQGAFAGMRLRNPQPNEDIYGEGGVVVAAVERQSRAWAAGLRTGDLILEVNRKATADLDGFNTAVESNEGFAILTVRREGRELLLLVR